MYGTGRLALAAYRLSAELCLARRRPCSYYVATCRVCMCSRRLLPTVKRRGT